MTHICIVIFLFVSVGTNDAKTIVEQKDGKAIRVWLVPQTNELSVHEGDGSLLISVVSDGFRNRKNSTFLGLSFIFKSQKAARTYAFLPH